MKANLALPRLLVLCVSVSVSGVLFSVGVCVGVGVGRVVLCRCVCVCDLLICVYIKHTDTQPTNAYSLLCVSKRKRSHNLSCVCLC